MIDKKIQGTTKGVVAGTRADIVRPSDLTWYHENVIVVYRKRDHSETLGIP
ncbi:hypothetical protein [Roseovarius sp. A46]|uniref:hypothetical protein n=1 Tax=Roseovarius sp. A46 TaxID=2109331 RepID=UPI0013E97683|nr:hypothetical protein [Roseovarius sp. A46]